MVYTQVTTEQVREALQQWGLGDLRTVMPVRGGAANSNYRVQRVGKPALLLKICEEMGPEESARSARMMTWLADHGVPLPKPRRGPDGALVDVREGKAWLWLPWIKGKALGESLQTVRHVGGLLAHVHTVPVPDEPLPKFTLGEPIITSIRQTTAQHGLWDPFLDRVDQHWAKIRKHLPAELPAGVLHGDIFGDNLIVRGDKVVAILDWEDVSMDWCALDLAMALVGCAWWKGELSVARWRALLAGYEAVRPLSSAERASLPTLVRLATLGIAVWQFRQFQILFPRAEERRDYREYERRLEHVLPR